jgi:peptidyl-prolyl cis-trans isomerase B (cyclophilin B)
MKRRIYFTVGIPLTLLLFFTITNCKPKKGESMQTGTSNPAGTQAVIETKFGKIVIDFLPNVAPKTVDNFKKLASQGFYNGTTFHRVIPGFMIQGGDPNSKSPDKSSHGTGGPGYTIKAEFNEERHTRGAVSMARSAHPDSAGSQFFIVIKDSNYLDRQYTVFGRVVEGMDVADKIVAAQRDGNDNPIERVEMKVSLR